MNNIETYEIKADHCESIGAKAGFGSIAALNNYFLEQTRSGHAGLVNKSLIPDIGPFFVAGDGTGNEPAVLIGEAPGKDEVLEGRPFVGAAGKILDDLLDRSGIRRERLYITNTVKYRLARPGKRPGALANRPVKKPEIDLCSGWLAAELNYIRPGLVLTLGNTALQGIMRCIETVDDTDAERGIRNVDELGGNDADKVVKKPGSAISSSIGDVHGTRIEAKLRMSKHKFILIPLYHPASLIYNRQLRVQYELDLEEVRKCAQSIL